ncbi:hypothetical protein DPMN_077753 [Dreissena polymorpha]|uniref:C2H2-type domain-containing protein n=1 Tax=Dreissena polymorpha TaxID=45954 RepID=A0A9D3YL17_DREPO|nr:hypothetical protein DPMN_077753 [Dreissena polymorpha]
MSNYSKSDFFHWDDDDFDLDELLGACLHCSSDDSENVKPCKKFKVTKAIESVGVYQCTECPKTYKTMSRIRCHMISKHGYERVNGKYFICFIMLISSIASESEDIIASGKE